MLLDLYIANRKADVPENFSVLYNYNSKDLSSPTAVKNKFSSTITLYGTPNNNTIFGEIWNLGRILIPEEGTPGPYDTGKILAGVNFDPRKRVDFKIFNNSELIEAGYLQLIEVNVGLKETSYRLQLYGGLGDFFYTLQYGEDNKQKTLQDLYYGWKPTKLEEDTERLGVWDRNFIITSWAYLGYTPQNNRIEEDITAIPSYSGKYEDFSTNKVLVNADSLEQDHTFVWTTTAFPIEVSYEGEPYRRYKNKYVLVETPRELSEFEARDLRSIHQRAGLRFSSFFNAISRPENNGGYTVVLDPKIKDDTPYFQRSWILLDRPKFEKTAKNSRYDLTGYVDILDGRASSTTILIGSPYSTFDTTTYNTPCITFNTTIKIGFQMDADFFADRDKPAYWCGNTYEYIVSGTRHKVIWDYLGLRLEIFDPQTNEIIDSSTPYLFACSGPRVPSGMAFIPSMGHMRMEAFPYCSNYASQLIYNTFGGENKAVEVKTYKKELGETRRADGVVYEDYNSETPIEVRWNRIRKYSNFQIRARVFKLRQTAESDDFEHSNPSGWTWTTEIGAFRQWYMVLNPTWAMQNPSTALGNTNEIVAARSRFSINDAFLEDSVQDTSSPYGITKQTLFGNTSSPLKYLLDWAKLFDLRFRMDSFTKTVYIETRDSYYQNDIGDLKVDLNKNVVINPTIAKYKAFGYGLPVAETYASNIYNRKTTTPYGKHDFTTGYEFNDETNDIFKDSVYKALIPYSQSSYYFSHMDTHDIPSCALSPSYKISLYREGTGGNPYEVHTWDWTFLWDQIHDSYGAVYNDPQAKMCLFSPDDSYVDGVNSLVFYNGKHYTQDYIVSDDTQEMMELNNEPCYILSRDYNEVMLPGFVPIFLNSYFPETSPTLVSYSYNFEAPQFEFNNSEIPYSSDAPLYQRFWRKYMDDLYNENGKTITVYAFVEGRPEEMMRRFWFFQNSIWVINEIKNYNISSPNTPVQMILAKVDNPTNYFN